VCFRTDWTLHAKQVLYSQELFTGEDFFMKRFIILLLTLTLAVFFTFSTACKKKEAASGKTEKETHKGVDNIIGKMKEGAAHKQDSADKVKEISDDLTYN